MGEACVPPSGWPLESGRKPLMGHLELASGNNMLPQDYKSCARQQKKKKREAGSRKWEGVTVGCYGWEG